MIKINESIKKVPSISSLAQPRSLQSELDEIDRKYELRLKTEQAKLPEELGLQKIEYTPKTDDEIKLVAESDLADYKIAETNRINADIESGKTALEKAKSEAASALGGKREVIDQAFEEAKFNASNDALKRGLARSSVAANTQSEYDGMRAREMVSAAASYNDEIARLNSEIGALESKREQALRDFDISYAAKLAMKVSDLIDERDQKVIEAIKYNNTVQEKETQYSSDRLKAIAQLTGMDYDNLKKQVDLYTDSAQKLEVAKSAEKYDVFLTKLTSMSKNDALKELESNPIYRSSLTDDDFEKLYLNVAWS